MSKPSDGEIIRALIDSIHSMNVLVTMLKSAGLDTHDIAANHIEVNESILAKYNVFLTPQRQAEHLANKINEFRNIKIQENG